MLYKLIPTSKTPKRKITHSAIVTTIAMTSFSHSSFANEAFSKKLSTQQGATDVIHVSTSPIQLEKIAVAENVEVIDAQSPTQQAAASALDLLKGQAGVFVSGTNSTYGQSVQMRGYDPRGVKITVDNVTQDFYSGLYGATFIDPSLIRKVYVHKGASSLAHGGGALAGVVSMKTVNASDLLKKGKNVGGRLLGGINSNDNSYLSGASLYGRNESIDALLSYSQRKKYLVDTSGLSEKSNHEKIHNWLLKTTWYAHPTYNIALQLREYRNDGISLKQPAGGNQRYKNTPHERYSHQRNVSINQYFAPQNRLHWQAEWDLYYTDLFLEQVDLVKQKKGEEYQAEKRNQYTSGTKLTHHFMLPVEGWFNNHIENGIEYYQQKQEPSNKHAISYPPAHLSNLSGWINNDITLHSLPVTFSAGTRFTRYVSSRKGVGENKDTNWSSRFAVSVTPTDWLALHSSYSEGYRTPRMAELYNNSLHFKTGFWDSKFRPSPDLQPETNKTAEIGTKLSFENMITQGDSLQFGTTFFSTKAKNHIAIDGFYFNTWKGYFPDRVYYVNIPSASIHGLDSFISYKTHWFDLNINHNLTTGTEDNTNYSLSSIRPETLLVRLNAPVADTGFTLGWVGEFAAKTQLQGNDKYKEKKHTSPYGLNRYNQEVIQYEGYNVHNFYLNYQADAFIQGLSSTLTMKNAFDKQYVSSMGVPQEGRNFYLNVNYQW